MSHQLERVLAKVHGMTPAQLAQLEARFAREERIQAQQKAGRAVTRVDNLVFHYERMKARIKAKPNHPKIKVWWVKLEEYKTSLLNWDKFGQETPPGPKAGVTVNVPLGRLGLKSGG